MEVRNSTHTVSAVHYSSYTQGPTGEERGGKERERGKEVKKKKVKKRREKKKKKKGVREEKK